MTYLIGIAGAAGVGKDTAAQYLEEQGFARYAFAAPIKRGLCAMFADAGLTHGHFECREIKEKPLALLGISPRRLAQTLGTEWGRDLVHPAVWLLLAGEVYAEHCRRGARGLVVSDVRFANEADWIRRQGGQVWQIIRPGVESVEAHASEAGISHADCDVHIMNTSGIANLYAQIDAALQALERAA